jgi:membrane-bound lytic murein transglycosylase D
MSEPVLRKAQSSRAILWLAATFFYAALAATAQQSPSRTAIDDDFARLNSSLQATAEATLSRASTAAVSPATDQHRSLPSPESTSTNSLPNLAPSTRVNARLLALQPQLLQVLNSAGMPAGLIAVVAAESSGRPDALSPKGARGLWQLMPQTARRYGLTVDDARDDRLDLNRSTTAAVHYLKDLYLQFGSWPLALAAYNWGEQNLAAAIHRLHTTDFTTLAQSGALPAETRAYVPAVLAHWRLDMPNHPDSSSRAGTTVFAQAESSAADADSWLSATTAEALLTDSMQQIN